LPVEFTISAPATRGSVDLDQATGEFTYTAGTNQTGTDVFTITIVDSGTPQQDATATVTVTIGAPGALVAESLTLSVTPGETVLSDLRSAVSGGFPPYTFAGATPSQQGSVTIDPDGAFSYTADSTASGTDSFTYTVTDSETMGVSAATTVEGTVFIAFQAEEPSPTPTATSSPVPSPTPSPTMPGSDMTPTAISTRGPATVPGTMPVHDYPTSAVPIDPTLANGGGVSQLPATGQGTRTGTMPVWLVLLLAGLLVASAMVMRYLWPARR
jgi:VCBS repeat-containing protein